MMKRLLLTTAALGMLTLGFAARADAALVFTLNVCQAGYTCTTVTGAAADLSPAVTYHDFTVKVITSATEDSSGSFTTTASTEVKRIATTDPDGAGALSSTEPLDVWLTVTNFNLPLPGPNYLMNTSLGVSTTPFNIVPASNIQYQGWLSTSNASGFPPAGSTTNNVIGCVPATTSCNVVGSPAVSLGGAIPFSLTSLTRFNINSVDGVTYGTTGNVSVVATAIPEPASMALLGSGLLGIGAAIRRRRRKVA